ncbi:MAG: LamG domain-containing protein [Candidatus Micrarchaeota archaeon]|nr:LamG domain-containing protein [Candidatus Micrarchaeota archaeon]
MKKAFLFSVIFILIFTTLILLSVFYLRMMQMNELSFAQTKNITRILYVRDDIASDILDYLQLSVSIQSNSTNMILNISDTLPSPYSDPRTTLNTAYAEFINGTYSNETNLLNPATNLSVISLNTTAFENAPSLQFIGSNSSLSLNYSYTNLNKNELIINGSSLVRNYSISITFNDTCLNNNCTNATWAGGSPNVDSTTAALWHFDEGSDNYVYDSSGNGNTGTSGAFPTWVSGRFNMALNFTGSSYVTVNNSDSLGMSGNLTVELWFRTTSGGGTAQFMLDTANGSGFLFSNYGIYIDSDNAIHGIIGGVIGESRAYADLVSSTIVQTNKWYHVALTANGTNITLYVNGVLDSSGSLDVSPLPNDNNLSIGAPDAGWGSYFLGTIDEVAIYSRAKSAAEIAADANLFHWDWSPTAMNSNLSAVWHFDEGVTNTTTADSSGNGNTGTLNGATWNASGKYNYSLNFSGSQYINVSHSPTLNVTGNLTVEAWIKSQNILSSNYQTILFKGNSTAENYGLYLKGSNLYFEWISGSVNTLKSSSSNIQNNTWYHVAAVFIGGDSTPGILYVNGVEQALGSPVPVGGSLTANTGNLTIGANSSHYFYGTIDEVAIYSRAKSAAEIVADANPLYISTDLRDSINNSILLRGSAAGYVNAGANNTFYVTTNGGSLNMTVGAYAGFYSLRAYANNTQVNILTAITESGVSSMQAILPIQLRIYQQTFSSLIIAEK